MRRYTRKIAHGGGGFCTYGNGLREADTSRRNRGEGVKAGKTRMRGEEWGDEEGGTHRKRDNGVQAGSGADECKLQRAKANNECGACLLVLFIVVLVRVMDVGVEGSRLRNALCSFPFIRLICHLCELGERNIERSDRGLAVNLGGAFTSRRMRSPGREERKGLRLCPLDPRRTEPIPGSTTIISTRNRAGTDGDDEMIE